jgi:hypothetical protein
VKYVPRIRRRTLLLAAGLLTAAALSGCGSAETTGTSATSSAEADTELPEVPELDASRSTSARFSGTDTITFDGIEDVSTIEGAFDWRTRTGWVTETSDVYSTELVQIGDRCYRRELPGRWKESAADDVDGLCNAALLSNPATEFQLISMTANDEMTVVGEERVDGDSVTHYRGSWSLHSNTAQVDYWVDDDGIVRRSQLIDETAGIETERSYSDLGAEVTVTAPTSPAADLRELVSG